MGVIGIMNPVLGSGHGSIAAFEALPNKVKAIIRLHESKGDIIVKMDSMGYSVEGTRGVKYYVDISSVTGDYSCDCPAFRFGNGLDDKGYCKHIEVVLYARENGVVIRSFDDIMMEDEE